MSARVSDSGHRCAAASGREHESVEGQQSGQDRPLVPASQFLQCGHPQLSVVLRAPRHLPQLACPTTGSIRRQTNDVFCDSRVAFGTSFFGPAWSRAQRVFDTSLVIVSAAGARLVTCSSSNTATLREVSSHQLAAVALFSEHSTHNAILDSLFSSGLFRPAPSGRSPEMALEQDSMYRDKAHRACCGGLGAISIGTPKVVVAVELISRCV